MRRAALWEEGRDQSGHPTRSNRAPPHVILANKMKSFPSDQATRATTGLGNNCLVLLLSLSRRYIPLVALDLWNDPGICSR